MEVQVLEAQSLADIAVQQAGTFEAIFDIAVANNRSITDNLTAGDTLFTAAPQNKATADYYRVRNITPATAMTPCAKQEGIGYWYVELDFVVS